MIIFIVACYVKPESEPCYSFQEAEGEKKNPKISKSLSMSGRLGLLKTNSVPVISYLRIFMLLFSLFEENPRLRHRMGNDQSLPVSFHLSFNNYSIVAAFVCS
jgi:hypothetical protein